MPLSFPSLDFLLAPAWKRRACLDKLSNDVLVDIVFDHLGVVDILRLRRVSIQFLLRNICSYVTFVSR